MINERKPKCGCGDVLTISLNALIHNDSICRQIRGEIAGKKYGCCGKKIRVNGVQKQAVHIKLNVLDGKLIESLKSMLDLVTFSD